MEAHREENIKTAGYSGVISLLYDRFSLIWWSLFSCRSRWWRARFCLLRAPRECRANTAKPIKQKASSLLWRTWLPCRHLTWQRRAGSRAAGSRGTDVQPDAWTRQGIGEPPDARRRSSSSPGEAGLQFLGGRAPRAVRQSAGRPGGGGCGDLWYSPPRPHCALTSTSSWKYDGCFYVWSMVTVILPIIFLSFFSPSQPMSDDGQLKN